MTPCPACGRDVPSKGDVILTDGNPCQCPQAVDAFLLTLYASCPKLRALSDEIHHARLQTGKACPDCVLMALKELAQ